MGLDHDLQQFTSTQDYHRHFTGLLYTDGIQYLAEHGQCFWLIDLVGSHQHTLREFAQGAAWTARPPKRR